ncbi:lantibiotic dehydratase [Streptomyces sp. NPDC059258]|uniref:lantibiotic dehydratase n=1 Tax=unclassified Streptomyces TaxID=2593676 RepID=UPI0036B370E9
MALSLLAHRTRLVSRPVPCGLFAGVTETEFGSEATVRRGAEHCAVARTDGEVGVLIDLAASPIPYGDLFDKLLAEAAGRADEVRKLLDALVDHRTLITCLQPPATEGDALR